MGESFALLKETTLNFPPTVATLMSLFALVNLNMEIFRVECLMGALDIVSVVNLGLVFPFATFAGFVLMFCLWFVLGRFMGWRQPGSEMSEELFREFKPSEFTEERTSSESSTSSESNHSEEGERAGAYIEKTMGQMVSESSSPQFARICLAGWFKLLIMGYPSFCIPFLPVLVGCLPIPDRGHRLTK